METQETAANNTSATPQPQYIIAAPTKNMAAGLLLALFFGPLGLIYSTVTGAIVMIILSVIVGLATLGLGLVITQIICVIWAYVAINNHNKKVYADMGMPPVR